MSNIDTFKAKSVLDVDGKSYEIHRLKAVADAGFDVSSLPYSLKILLENLLRTENGSDITAQDIEALAGWDPSSATSREISFTPARVLLQDFTGVPSVVDLAAMR
ncbi:MAG: aconitate hydratase, partial [Alcaligenaceae bacterium]|nr:aconitate hydratase [Alcaligenaceae bacterium]